MYGLKAYMGRYEMQFGKAPNEHREGKCYSGTRVMGGEKEISV